MTRPSASFTLLELMAVVVVLGVLTAMVTLNARALSERGCLRAAANKIGAVVRLGLLEASTSGMPCVVAFESSKCTLQKPIRDHGQWRWRNIAEFRLGDRARIRCVSTVSRAHCESQEAPPWKLPLSAGIVNRSCFIALQIPAGPGASVTVDGMTGFEEFDLVEAAP